MKYIKRDNLTLPPDWEIKANKALDELRKATPEERKRILNHKSSLWKELKEELLRCSHGKCWYCESAIPHASHGDVDHWRPKSEVAECPRHSGYWWLAFDWQNYRYSCELCNRPNTDPETGTRGGKETHFPLCDETKRVFDENSVTGVLCEEPMLLDPVVVADTTLLTFDENGMAQPARNAKRQPKEYERAKKSIEIYHLNRSKLVNRRQFTVCNKVKRLIEEGDKYLLLAEIENSMAARDNYQKVVDELYTMIHSEDVEYTSAAKAVLCLYVDREWVRDLVRAA